MKRVDGQMVAGAVLITFGVLLFLQSTGWIRSVGATSVWAFLFGAAGLVFVYVFLRDRSAWWAILPALPLLGLAGLLVIDVLGLAPSILGPAFFLGSISAAFWLVYWVRRDFWWAIIPGGTVATVATMTLAEPLVPDGQLIGLLFLGIGVTFLGLYFLPEHAGRQRWAIYPAAILLILSAAFSLAFGVVGRFLLPLAIMVLGGWLIYRAWRSTRPPSA